MRSSTYAARMLTGIFVSGQDALALDTLVNCVCKDTLPTGTHNKARGLGSHPLITRACKGSSEFYIGRTRSQRAGGMQHSIKAAELATVWISFVGPCRVQRLQRPSSQVTLVLKQQTPQLTMQPGIAQSKGLVKSMKHLERLK